MARFLPARRNTELWNRPASLDLFNRFDRWFDDFDMPTLFGEERTWAPSIDVSETEDSLVVKAEMPGMNKEDIDITLSNGILTLSGEKKEEREDKQENYHVKESRHGSFRRSFRVPADVEADKIEATYTDGVLRLTVPKSEGAKAKKIAINS